MKKLKKSLSMIIVVILMAMVMASTATARLSITLRTNGNQNASSVTFSSGQPIYVRARIANVSELRRDLAFRTSPTAGRNSSMSPWLARCNATAFPEARGWIE